MPTSLLNRGTMNSVPGPIDDTRAYQLALELSLMGINSNGQSETPELYDVSQKVRSSSMDGSIYDESMFATNERKSANMTETVPVPSSEHVAEIVGRQGCKIKALRAKTNTYIKTPVRGAEPVFVVTGRKEDVNLAKQEILSAAEHFSQIRASRRQGSAGTSSGSTSPTSTPGHVTIQVRVPYKVVGLVVGPKGATIKRIQQATSTYIITPGREKEPVFEVTGMPDNVDKAREEIEKHIAARTGTDNPNNDLKIDDFHLNGIDSGFHDSDYENDVHFTTYNNSINIQDNLVTTNGSYMPSSVLTQCNSSNITPNAMNMKISEFSAPASLQAGYPTCNSYSDLVDTAAIWCDSPAFGVQRSNSISLSTRSTNSALHSIDDPHPRTRRTNSDPLAAAFQRIDQAFSSSPTSSQGSMSPVGVRRGISPTRRGCHLCGGDITAALVPCGHNSFCMLCAKEICERESDRRLCPICHTQPTQAIRIRT